MTDNDKIRIVIKRPGDPAEIVEIENSFDELKRVAGLRFVEAGRLHTSSGIVDVFFEDTRGDAKPNVRSPIHGVIVGPVIALDHDDNGDALGLGLVLAETTAALLDVLAV